MSLRQRDSCEWEHTTCSPYRLPLSPFSAVQYSGVRIVQFNHCQQVILSGAGSGAGGGGGGRCGGKQSVIVFSACITAITSHVGAAGVALPRALLAARQTPLIFRLPQSLSGRPDSNIDDGDDDNDNDKHHHHHRQPSSTTPTDDDDDQSVSVVEEASFCCALRLCQCCQWPAIPRRAVPLAIAINRFDLQQHSPPLPPLFLNSTKPTVLSAR